VLVITRKKDEVILIGRKNKDGQEWENGEYIEIMVVESYRDYAKIGIKAPKDVIVIRKELQVAGEENIKASSAIPKETLDKLLIKTQNELQIKREE
jgi:sRNA-binding carbon storage regulator CsrA